MAFNTARGKFTITNFSVTPSPMAYGDAFTISITLTNKTGQKLTGFELHAGARFRNTVLTVRQALIEEYGNDVYSPDWYDSSDGDEGGCSFGIYYDDINPTGWGMQKAISWPNNTAKTFTYQARFMGEANVVSFYRSRDACDAREDPIAEVDLNTPDLSARLLQMPTRSYSFFNNAWSLSISYTYGSSGEDDDWADFSTSYADYPIVISRYWNPAVSLSVKRGLANGSANDEGERLLVTAKLSKNEYADASAMFCRLYYEENGTATTSSSYIDLTPSISALLAGVTDDASLATQTFSNGSNWSFLLVFGDDYETASAPASIALAFANVHMSGASTGGVAFGRFSSSSEGNPKFECAYPATFEQPVNADGGIEGVTNYASGEVATGGTWIDGKPIYRYTAVFTASIGSSATNIHAIPSGHDKTIRLSLLMDNIRPVPYWATSTYWASIYISGNNIRAQAGSSEQKSHSFVLIMEYTRT